MSEPRPPLPVRYFVSIIYKEKNFVEVALRKLAEEGWVKNEVSEEMDFTHTDYYNKEMGEHLKRVFVFFKGLQKREMLVSLKLLTNSIEKELSEEKRRKVNIDPGYITLENVILATGKNYTHRIYIGEGIYADLTLIFQRGSYRPLPWTYPDYASERIIKIFNLQREKYKEELRKT